MSETSTDTAIPLHLSNAVLDRFEGDDIVCLVDGEHYPPVTTATLEALESNGAIVSGLVFLGGTEKIEEPTAALATTETSGGAEIYTGQTADGDVLDAIERAILEQEPSVVVDLSDEPIVTYEDRFEIASTILTHGVDYLGADFVFESPAVNDVLEGPSISIIGTGKRIGKTAVSVSIARTMDEGGYDPTIVCMSRGGPPDPVVVDTSERAIDADALIELAEQGEHAASDYLEDALLADVPTVGCRRCGGGMAGNPVASNVVAGAEQAAELADGFVIMEGSGATMPPVETDTRIVLIGAAQPLEHILQYFGQYRVQTSDLAVVTMCEEPLASDEKVRRIEEGITSISPDIEYLLTTFRPEPGEDVSGRSVFVATTAPEAIASTIETALEEEHGCDVVGLSTNLSNRAELRTDLDDGTGDADVLLTEIKAASIDVAGRYAKEHGLEIVFMHNEATPIRGSVDSLDAGVVSLCERTLADRRPEE
ncbi:2,3-diphosphoglycerate synthetase [Halalkalicoccus salilacus]|uniref:2,3-diphosphoglycerate synthetase n=1 Tax=Halalkalicoccus salilacus TaxID=3117459 RepID=UPI00300EE2BF